MTEENARPCMPENDFSVLAYFKDPLYKQKYGVDLYGAALSGKPDACDVLCVLDGRVADVSVGSVRSITVEHPVREWKLFSRYLYITPAPWLKTGDRVRRGETVGYQGKTAPRGDSALLFQLWRTPEDFIFVKGAASRYAVDPFESLYLFPGQRVKKDVRGAVKRLPREYSPFAAGSVLLASAPENALPIYVEPFEDDRVKDGFLSPGRYAAVARVDAFGKSFIKAVVSGEMRYIPVTDDGEEIIPPFEKNC